MSESRETPDRALLPWGSQTMFYNHSGQQTIAHSFRGTIYVLLPCRTCYSLSLIPMGDLKFSPIRSQTILSSEGPLSFRKAQIDPDS